MTAEALIRQIQGFIEHGLKPTAIIKAWDGDSGEYQPVSGFIYDVDSVELQTDSDDDDVDPAPEPSSPESAEIVIGAFCPSIIECSNANRCINDCHNKPHPVVVPSNFPISEAATESAREREGDAEELAQRFHETYESLAPHFGYETRKESAKPWADVPENNKRLMIAVCAEVSAHLLERVRALREERDRLQVALMASAEEFRLLKTDTGNAYQRGYQHAKRETEAEIKGLREERDAARNELGEAWKEIFCCDDIRLDQGMVVAVSDLQRARELAETTASNALDEIRRLKAELTAVRGELEGARKVIAEIAKRVRHLADGLWNAGLKELSSRTHAMGAELEKLATGELERAKEGQ